MIQNLPSLSCVISRLHLFLCIWSDSCYKINKPFVQTFCTENTTENFCTNTLLTKFGLHLVMQ